MSTYLNTFMIQHGSIYSYGYSTVVCTVLFINEFSLSVGSLHYNNKYVEPDDTCTAKNLSKRSLFPDFTCSDKCQVGRGWMHQLGAPVNLVITNGATQHSVSHRIVSLRTVKQAKQNEEKAKGDDLQLLRTQPISVVDIKRRGRSANNNNRQHDFRAETTDTSTIGGVAYMSTSDHCFHSFRNLDPRRVIDGIVWSQNRAVRKERAASQCFLSRRCNIRTSTIYR